MSEVHSHPAFYAIIPAHVRYCKDLEPAAKLLYGEITALCSKEGYCWASNQYFADLYGVEIRTVQFWLESLKTNEFIFVEVIKEGMQTRRRIWISKEIQEFFAKRKNIHADMKKMTSRHEKNDTHINTTSNTEEKDCLSEPSGPGIQGPPSAPSFSKKEAHEGDEVSIPNNRLEVKKISKQDLISKAVREKKDWDLSEIQEAWDILKEQKIVNDPMQFLCGTIRNLRNRRKMESLNKKMEKEKETCPKKKYIQMNQELTEAQRETLRRRSEGGSWERVCRNPS